MSPKRIQRRRTKGWRMPAGAVSVTRPGKWGNPYRVGAGETVGGVTIPAVTPADAVALFRERWERSLASDYPGSSHAFAVLNTLRGRDLACWCRLCERHQDGKPLGVSCPDCAPCHADVLLDLANAPEAGP